MRTCVRSPSKGMFSGDHSEPDTCGYGDEIGGRELLDAYLVELDPALDGFGPVFIELYAIATGGGWEGFEVRQTATVTANRLLVFTTESEALARKLSQKYTGVSRTLGEVLYPLLLAAECGLQAANVRLLNRSKLALP